MEMFYQDDTLFVDLSGFVDVDNLKVRLFSVLDLYNISHVVLSVSDVFNYKRGIFNDLKEDYSRMYGGNIIIKK